MPQESHVTLRPSRTALRKERPCSRWAAHLLTPSSWEALAVETVERDGGRLDLVGLDDSPERSRFLDREAHRVERVQEQSEGLPGCHRERRHDRHLLVAGGDGLRPDELTTGD